MTQMITCRKIGDLECHDRPRERLHRYGAEGISDAELISVLIGSGGQGRSVTAIANDVVNLLDRVNGSADLSRLTQIKGLGPAKTAILAAAIELGRRQLSLDRRRIRIPQDALPVLSHYADRQQELFLCTTLNGAHEVIRTHVVSVGLVNRTMVHPREVYACAIQDRAAAILVAHNHPSGNCTPSAEDREVTNRLGAAGRVIGISLLDHIIFTRSGYYSFLEQGEL
ncbi:RadC family protein [Spirochaeta africana]|uniref:DNA repair protein radc n=1 Tax=Spirochaeta africana (strain ATCC 700263 / DSM 8902 / Z-7692) TaxID=889378 RepID=H9UKS1_SPIAZ|nr:DNA repair protein RadC [Spirochaeta africana]AFG38114.1 DNA repair protein radc [Spirochaeta africana DSM 8902]